MSSDKEEWIGVSDIMSGLMMVFLFISVLFMEQVNSEKVAVTSIAQTYKSYKDELHAVLKDEFKEDLTKWNAEILKDSTIRFNEPNVLFDRGRSAIKPRFEEILSDFFPRYIKVLASDRFKDTIDEVRIEGHTSSVWETHAPLQERYLNNAKLSQERSFAILDYCFSLERIAPKRTWLTTVLRANGLAFAKPILVNGKEDFARSRRVEFRVLTKAEERIYEILRTVGD